MSTLSSKSRNAAIALGAAALALLVGIMSYSWFTAPRGHGGVGLLGIQDCSEGLCQSVSWGDMGKEAPGDVKIFGYLGFAFSLIAALACMATAVMMLIKRERKLLELNATRWLAAPITLGLLGQIVFVNKIMGTGDMRKLSIGWSLIVAVAGALAAAIVIRTMVAPALRATADATPAPAPAPQPYTIA